ncbi:hypothetical protein ABFS82_11G115200 [Erythranthe guttata]|nr:PREDICTED: DNA-directed RNA polymerase III subunit rpc3-like isoform X1 [Erythranthe guttata]|eukprot:XP_012835153.1 PREDICTED: DNA-directed RNA polymerase III subunit rpc3-like isoform X1 [Erythranthe guttata]
MASPYGIQLAVHIISAFYGDLCSKVCECLIRRGTQSLAQIIRFTDLNRENAINCLRVLIHQNCVQAFTIQQDAVFGEPPRMVTQYMALFDNVIHKLRAPKFYEIVSEELGKDCLVIFQGLVQHGRLSVNDMIAGYADIEGSSENVGRESFTKLVNARFVEHCPAPDPHLEPPVVDEKGKKKKTQVEEPPLDQRVLAAAAPMESMRFFLEMDDHSEEKGNETTTSVRSGQKRKQDEGELDADKKKEVLWRVNVEEFLRRLRHKACIAHVKSKINEEAAIVLSAMLELSKQSESGLKAEKSEYLSINAIYDEVIKKEGGLGMDFERVRSLLDQLGCETLSTGMDESYCIDIKEIIELSQNEEVESLVMRRYGPEAYRIYRLLSKAGRLMETEKISDSTFVEKKATIAILYKLWKDDFLQMEHVKTSTAKQSDFRLWTINKEQLQKQVLNEMYHAALNLKLRIAHEKDQAKEVIKLPKDKLVGESNTKYVRWANVTRILESCLMDLDDAIMLFHHF